MLKDKINRPLNPDLINNFFFKEKGFGETL